MTSINDVAKLAGCSATLVSRVLNDHYGVSDKSREKIKKAINELGYTPNAHARSLVTKRTNTIGVVVDTLCDAYFFNLISGVEEAIDQYHYDVLFCSGKNNAEKKESYIDFFMQERTDGIIIYGSYLKDSALIKKLQKARFPFVLVEYDAGQANINNVLIDNRYGSKLAVDYLVQCGCRHIFHVEGDMTMQASKTREEGYLDAMRKYGDPSMQVKILTSGWSEEQGYDTIKKYLQNNHELPDAFYFSADQSAFGGMKALQEASVSIPDEVMLVGFDDDRPRIYFEKYVPLTTVHQPLYEMGKEAANILLQDIKEKREKKQKRTFSPSLVIRQTTREQTETIREISKV